MDSWAVFHDKQYAGKMTMMDDGREVIGSQLRYRGHSLNSTNPDELAQAKADAIAAKKQLKAYISAPVKAQLISGDVWISQLWNGDTTQAKAEQPNLAYVSPKEGCTIWGDSMCIPQERAEQAGRARVDELHPPARGGSGNLPRPPATGPPMLRRPRCWTPRCPIPPRRSSSGWSTRWIWARTRPPGIRSGPRSSRPEGAELRLPNEQVLQHTRRYLELIGGRELSREEQQSFIAETVESYEKYYNRGFVTYRKSVTEAGQFAAIEWSGQGSLLRDLLGREYIDCLGGYGIFSAGVNHPKVVKAVTDQIQRMALNSQELLEPWRAALGKVLAAVTPGELQNSFFINNGTDAIEGAIKLTRLYTRRSTFISTLGGFHGKSLGSLSLMGKASFREPFQSGLQDVRFVPYGDADALEAEFRRCASVGVQIAGLVLEPVQGEAGGIVPPADYFPRARELCTRYGALLIADEIQTGMGRTGKLWGVDHWNVVPDIMCVGKSIGGGVMPLSAFISTAEIWEVMIPNPIIHSTTFGGNPLACAAGLAAIEVTLEEDLPGQAASKGDFLLRELGCLQQKYPGVLQEAHGKGLLIGMEFPTQEIGWKVASGLFKRGVLVAGTYSKARVIRIEPALGIPIELLKEMLNRLEDAFLEVSKAR